MGELANVFEQLSEETLFKLVQVVTSQMRRVALRRAAGKDASDLPALLELSRLLAVVHRRKLFWQENTDPDHDSHFA